MVIWGFIALASYLNRVFFQFEKTFTNTVAVSCIGKVCTIKDLIMVVR